MRSKTLSKTSHRISSVENSELEEEPCLSGAFIRSLVRQLSSSRFKEPMDPVSVGAEVSSHQLIEDPSKVDRKQRLSQQRAQTQPKKQVRRRLHITKPYQERPINMAEARREIVAALKFHRATMKQASQQQQQNYLMQHEFRATSPFSLPMIDSSIGTTTYQLNSLSHKCMSSPLLPAASHPPNFCLFNTSLSPISFSETVNFSLPGRSLGLNLNLHEFTNLETSFSNKNCPSFPLFMSAATIPTSSSSSSCSSSFTTVIRTEVPSLPVEPFRGSEATSDSSVESLHPVLGEKEMAEIRSIGDQYNMEWNDNLNLAQSAWWNKFIETMDTSSQFQESRITDGCGEGTGIFDEVSCFPAWVPDQQLMDDINIEEVCLQDACLPCLDIGDIEGIDGEWLL